MKRFLTKNQRLLLPLFFSNPGKSFYMQEVGRILGKKPGVFQRALNGLVEEGILTSEFRANARYFKANTNHPFYPELKRIIAKSIGVEGSLRDWLKKEKGIEIAILYGSFAKGKERSQSDVDLLLVGSAESEKRILPKLVHLERKLDREINYKLYSPLEFRKKKRAKDPFLQEVLSDRHVVLKGDPHDV